MRKQITQERILKAINAIYTRWAYACKKERQFCKYAEKKEMGRDPAALITMKNRFARQINHYEKWEDIVLNLQVSHGVSGLNPHEFKIGPYGIMGVWCDSGLQVIESDLPRLAAQKYKVYRFWADFVEESWSKKDEFLYIWQKTKDGNLLVDLRFVSWQCLKAGWCNVWQEEDRYYLALGSGLNLYKCSALFVAAREGKND